MVYEYETKVLINNAPEYIGTLIGTDYIHCRVTKQSPMAAPVIAWTYFDEEAKCWVVNFHPAASTLSKAAQFALWRHEVGHIFFAHFSKSNCIPDDPIRSSLEAMEVGDIQINYYLLAQKYLMDEIGTLVKKLMLEHGEDIGDSKGYIDPEVALPSIGLAVQEYSYDIIHAYLHQKNDDKGGEGNNWTQNMMGMCGGIEYSDKPGSGADTKASVIAGVMASGEEKLEKEMGQIAGSRAGMGEIRLRDNPLPEWLPALETFARSIVTTILTDKRSHTRPQEVYKAYDIHIPTQRPRWAYKPEQVCFLVDTSGSMGNELKYVMPVVQYLNQHDVSVRLIAGDTRVTMDELIEPGMKTPEKVGSGGGTEISPLFDRATEYDPASLVVFTDGYVSYWPTNPGVPTLFVGCQTDVPWGTKA